MTPEGGLDVAKLNEALASAAEQAIEAGLVGPGKNAWVRITFIDVELANQHPRTVRVGVSVIAGGEVRVARPRGRATRLTQSASPARDRSGK